MKEELDCELIVAYDGSLVEHAVEITVDRFLEIIQ